jgi:TonB-linked SusC/RagA family outer membrane protein
MKKILFMVFLLVTAFLQQAAAQDRTVSGRVIDRATNEGLPGVTVLVPGTSVGAATNADGSFTLSVPSSTTELRFSSVGYTSIQQAIGTGANITVSLATDAKQLNEVVVTALGIEKEKRTLGYSTQTIEAGQLTQGRERSVLNSLQGKVAGVQINNASGGVGSSTRVVIRGAKSFTGSNQPLYVIDGIPIDNSSIGTGDNLNNGVDYGNRANDVNPEDVESINILKGPAATALYGSRAANGAIVITTKSGRGAARNGKKAEVTYTSSYVVDDILFLPEFQNTFGQGTDVHTPDTRENWSFGPRFDGVDRVWGQVVNNQQRSKPYVGLPNNVRDFFDLGKTFTNSLSLGGGDAKTNYILSAAHTSQSGVTPGTNYERSSVKIGGETKLTNKITTSANLTYTHTGSKLASGGQGNNSVYNNVLQTPRDISLLELKDLSNPFNDINGYYGAYTVNPWQVLNDNQNRNKVDRLFGNAQIGYVFNDHFRINGRAGVDTYSDRRSQYTAIRTPRAGSQNASVTDNGVYSENQISYQELTTDLIATYNGNITPDITVSALVGQQFNQRRQDIVGLQADQLVSNSIGANFANNRVPFVDPNAGSNADFERRIIGLYSTVDFGYKNFLFLGLQARNDWSSTLPKQNRSFFYPAVSASLVFTDLLNLKENKYFNFGKLRASYAQAGNDAGPYQTQSIYSITNPTSGFADADLLFPIGNVLAYTAGNGIASNTLQPEITKAIELGAELRFFQNRLTADVSVYDSRSTNQIVSVPISAASGFTAQTRNVGEIQNRGIEVLVGGTPVRVGGFSWDLSVNFTKNQSKVVSIFPGTEEIAIGGLGGASLTARVGEPYGTLRAVDLLTNAAGQTVVSPTTGIPLQSAIKTIGTINPDFTAGLTSTFTYKGLALNVVFDTKQGGIMYSRTKSIQRFVGTTPETLYNDRQPFIVPNSVIENTDGSYATNTVRVDVPAYWTALSNNAGNNVVDASYTKLREVALSYTLPSKLTENTPFGSLSFGLTGRNLLLWRAKGNTFVDPEINSLGNGNVQGFDFSSSPSLRSYGANIRVTF